jgi:hypothetical protein
VCACVAGNWIVLQVPVTATVEDVLQETLREHRKEDGTLPTYLSRCFELRLPDCDRVGYPDDDVPGSVGVGGGDSLFPCGFP